MAVNLEVMRENNNEASPARWKEPHVPGFSCWLILLVLKLTKRVAVLPRKLSSYKYDSGMQVNQLRVTSAGKKKKGYSAQ